MHENGCQHRDMQGKQFAKATFKDADDKFVTNTLPFNQEVLKSLQGLN